MRQVLSRPEWQGNPIQLGELFVVRKAGSGCAAAREARCILQTHQLGWELRLMIGEELLRSEVCPDRESVHTTGETWKQAMVEKGWS